ncbi:ferrochelatase [Kocuria rhizophila]|nr:ferrochelatase [Kocuria rhizophila]
MIPFLRNVTRGRGIPDAAARGVATHDRANGGVSPINAQNRALRDALRPSCGAGVEAARAAREPQLGPVRGGRAAREPRARGPGPACSPRARTPGTPAAASTARTTAWAWRRPGCRTSCTWRDRAVLTTPRALLRPYATKLRDSLLALRERTDGPARVLFTTYSAPMTDADAGRLPADELRGELRLRGAAPSRPRAGSWSRWASHERWSGARVPVPLRLPQVAVEPDICDVIEELPGKGVTGVAVVPLGFVSDHMEVLWDLDTEARDAAAEAGLEFERIPHRRHSSQFVAALADLVEQRRARPPRPRGSPRAPRAPGRHVRPGPPREGAARPERTPPHDRPACLASPSPWGLDENGEAIHR